MLKERILKLALTGAVALAVPTAAVLAHGSADAQKGLSTAAAQGADPEASETPDNDTDTGGANRPQNHGWFVSQAARSDATSGRAHGMAVSKVAQSDEGLPSGATK